MQGCGSKQQCRIGKTNGLPTGITMPNAPKPSWPLVCGFVVGYFFGWGRTFFYQHATISCFNDVRLNKKSPWLSMPKKESGTHRPG